MSILDGFMIWWNRLAHKNGKLKFRTQKEAADFVRRVQNENGGPNDKIVAMRKNYERINQSRVQPSQIRFDRNRNQAVL